MKRLLLIATAAAACAFLALGCSDETTVLPSERDAPGISVAGTGTVFGEPDIALVTLGVEAEADSVGDAREQAGAAMNAMVDALQNGGVEEDDIQTARFSVQPRYNFNNNRQELIGFTVSNLVTAKIRSIDDTGDLLDAAIEAGGSLARVDGLSFTIDDPSELETEARRLAMAEARSKAETLADAAEIDLGDAVSISESGGAIPLAFDEAAVRADALQEGDGDTAILAGELEVRVDVQVVYDVGD